MSRLYRPGGSASTPSQAARASTPGSLLDHSRHDSDDQQWASIGPQRNNGSEHDTGGRRSATSAGATQQRRIHTPQHSLPLSPAPRYASSAASSAGAAAAAASHLSSPPSPSPAAVVAAATASLAALAAPSAALLRNSSAADRRLMAHRARVTLARLQAEADGTRPRKGEPVRWNSSFVKKEKRLRRMFITHPSVYPVLSRHLAAWMIQRWWRRLSPEARQQRSRERMAAAASQGLRWVHPYTAWARQAERGSQRPWRPTGLASGPRGRHISSSYFLETGSYHTSLGSKVPTRAYRSWCAGKIARNWLYHRKAKRYREFAKRDLYTYAAIDIQRVWRSYKRRQAARQDPSLALHGPASVIQRAYKRFTQRRIFQYFRALILARQNSNPYLLLKLLDPREGSQLHDHSSGLYIRFRLGGAVFPPILYYKTFTNFAVTDINSFAPRDYARDRKVARENVHVTSGDGSGGGAGDEAHPSSLGPTDRNFWYRRYENNGWRPIVHDALLSERDPVLERTSTKTVPFHPSKLVRQMDALRKRKGKKIEWLKKLYTSGVVALPTQEQLAAQRGLQSGEGNEGSNGDADGDGAYDSDEEEWRAWKSASAARLAGAGTGAALPDPEQMLANLMALDTSSPALLLGGSNGGGGGGGGPGGGDNWESEADQLLEWCSGLGDFESYSDAWLVAATSRPNDPSYRLVDHVAPGRVATQGSAAQGQQSRRTMGASAASSSASLSSQGRPSSARRSPTQQQHPGSSSDSSGGLGPIDEGAALDAQLHAATLADEDENAELPAWIQQTASRAQLASAQASQSSLLAPPHQQSHSQSRVGVGSGVGSGGGSGRSRLGAGSSAGSQQLDATQPFPVPHVHLTAAVSSRPGVGGGSRAPPSVTGLHRSAGLTATLPAPLTATSHPSLARLQQPGWNLA